jgi:hypothetical protein
VSGFTRWLSRLQLSPRSQRVLTEAALDWRHEVATAPTLATRLWRHGRGGAGVTRALAGVFSESLVDVAISGWAIRLVLWLVVLVWPFLNVRLSHGLSDSQRTWSVVGAIIFRTFNVLPYAMALTVLTGRSRLRSPVVALVWIQTLMTAVLLFGVVPAYFSRMDPTGRIDTPSAFDVMPPAVLVFSLWFGTLLSLVADRARASVVRWQSTGVAFALLAVGIGGLFVINDAATIFHRNGYPMSLLARYSPLVFVAVYVLVMWRALIWWQERSYPNPQRRPNPRKSSEPIEPLCL